MRRMNRYLKVEPRPQPPRQYLVDHPRRLPSLNRSIPLDPRVEVAALLYLRTLLHPPPLPFAVRTKKSQTLHYIVNHSVPLPNPRKLSILLLRCFDRNVLNLNWSLSLSLVVGSESLLRVGMKEKVGRGKGKKGRGQIRKAKKVWWVSGGIRLLLVDSSSTEGSVPMVGESILRLASQAGKSVRYPLNSRYLYFISLCMPLTLFCLSFFYYCTVFLCRSTCVLL